MHPCTICIINVIILNLIKLRTFNSSTRRLEEMFISLDLSMAVER